VEETPLRVFEHTDAKFEAPKTMLQTPVLQTNEQIPMTFDTKGSSNSGQTRFYQKPMRILETDVQKTITPVVQHQQELSQVKETPLKVFEATKTISQTPVLQTNEQIPMTFDTKGSSGFGQTRFYRKHIQTRLEFPDSLPQSAEALFLDLPSGADLAMGGRRIDTSFSCNGLAYGYFADMKNECIIYHICQPYEDEEGHHLFRRISSFCPLGTVFDQLSLGCTNIETAIPCLDSANYYPTTMRRFAGAPRAPQRSAVQMSHPTKTRLSTPMTYEPLVTKTRLATPMSFPTKGSSTTLMDEVKGSKGFTRGATSFGMNKIIGFSQDIQRLSCCPTWAMCSGNVPICSPATQILSNTEQRF